MQKLLSLISGTALNLFVARGFCDLDEVCDHCICSDRGTVFLGRVLGCAQAADEGPSFPTGASEIHSVCGLLSAVLAGGIEGFNQVVSHIWIS